MNKLFLSLYIVGLFTASCFAQPINVMTFNIRYDNPRDSLNSWQYRKDFAANHVRFYDVDIMGAQEVLYRQMEDLKNRLPEYTAVGVGREDGKTKGEYSPIFYKKERFDLVRSGTFWLSKNPEAIGVKGWDAACERIVTWAILKDKATEKTFCFMNTHFDHMGKIARAESAKLLLKKAKEIAGSLPVIVSGDFNAEPTSDVVQIITDQCNPDCLTDSKQLARLVYGASGTFHDFGRIDYNNRPLIDYIFIKGNIAVKRYGVLAEMQDATYASDHHPVLITIEVE